MKRYRVTGQALTGCLALLAISGVGLWAVASPQSHAALSSDGVVTSGAISLDQTSTPIEDETDQSGQSGTSYMKVSTSTPLRAGAPRAWEGGGLAFRPTHPPTWPTVICLTVIPTETGWGGRGPGVGFAWYHNSTDGVWRHSYSTHLETISGTEMTLIGDDGRTRNVHTDRRSVAGRERFLSSD